MLRRWGRRSEVNFYGTRRRERDFWEDLDGIRYDNQFIFDELGWNFEPSEMGAAFGLEQLKKLDDNLARRRRNFQRYEEFFASRDAGFLLPRQTTDLETAWLGYPLLIAEVRTSIGPHCSTTSTVVASTPAPFGAATSRVNRCCAAGPS